MELARIVQRVRKGGRYSTKTEPREKVVPIAELYASIDAWLVESSEKVDVYDGLTGDFAFTRELSKSELEQRKYQERLSKFRVPKSPFQSPHVALLDLHKPSIDFESAFRATDARERSHFEETLTGERFLPRLVSDSETSGDCGVIAIAAAQGISYKESADFLVNSGAVSLKNEDMGAVSVADLANILLASNYQAVEFAPVEGLPRVRLFDLYDSGWFLRENKAIVQLLPYENMQSSHVIAWTGSVFEGAFMPPGEAVVSRVYRKYNPVAPREHHFSEDAKLRPVREVVDAYQKVAKRFDAVHKSQSTPVRRCYTDGRYGGEAQRWDQTVIR